MIETMAESVAERKETIDDDEIKELPKEVGILLLVMGIGGILLPGPVGAPFLVLGGLTLFPSTFRGLDRRMKKRFPKMHKEGMRQVRRFIHDLERRYPTPGETR
jgi:hypothetical protein